MEAAGLGVGVLALVGIFGDCIDLMTLIGAARRAGRDYLILETKLDIQQTLLLQWAERVSLVQEQQHPRLLDPATRALVTHVLIQIRSLLNDGAELQKKYGAVFNRLQEDPRAEASPTTDTAHDGWRAMDWIVSSGRREKFSEALRKIRADIPSLGLSPRLKVQWAAKGKAEFTALVDDLDYFVEKLNDIIPLDKESRSEMARNDINLNWNVDYMQRVYDAAHGWNHDFEDAAVWGFERNCQRRILERLGEQSVPDRKQNVAARYNTTLEWALDLDDNSRDGLSHWLRSGRGVYWVRGKAGSGKSTLMKFLCDNKTAKGYLKLWAGGGKHATAYFFLWRLGTEDQKSLPGLFQSILYQIVRAEPTLCKKLMPRTWKEAYGHDSFHFSLPTQDEIRQIFTTIPHCEGLPKICLFIDGLDEFAGDYLDGISFIKSIASGPNLKVLVSSRPEPAFVDAFKHLPNLRLEHLTQDDIRKYIEGTLSTHPYMQSLTEREPETARGMVSGLISKASGVFLWVVLACRSLLSGFASFDRISELQQRIDELPPELEHLFEQMLMKTESRYRFQASKLLRMCYMHVRMRGGDISTLGLALFDEHHLDTTRIPSAQKYSVAERRAKCEFLEGRLRSRCGGLLELHGLEPEKLSGISRFPDLKSKCLCGSGENLMEDHDSIVDSEVGFMHRSVYEFLDREETWSLECLRFGDEDFDPMTGLSCISMHLGRTCVWNFKGRCKQVIHHVRDLWQFASYANWERSPDRILPVVLALEDLLTLSPKGNVPPGRIVQQQCDESCVLSPAQFVIQLSVEASLPEVVEAYRSKSQKLLASWPKTVYGSLLDAAVRGDTTKRFLGDRSFRPVRPVHHVVQYLLSAVSFENHTCLDPYGSFGRWARGLQFRTEGPYQYTADELFRDVSITRVFLEARIPGSSAMLAQVAAWTTIYAPVSSRLPPGRMARQVKEEFLRVHRLLGGSQYILRGAERTYRPGRLSRSEDSSDSQVQLKREDRHSRGISDDILGQVDSRTEKRSICRCM